MTNKYPTPPVYVRYTGLFDFDALYAAIISWFQDYEYEWHEETYKHKVPSVKGAELEWNWYGEKEITDYIKYKISIKGHAWDVTEIEAGEKKKKLMNARIQLIMKGEVTTDWQKKWEKNKFTKFLGKVYEKHVIRREIEAVYVDTLWYRLWNLQAVLKKFFDMQTKWHEYKKVLGED